MFDAISLSTDAFKHYINCYVTVYSVNIGMGKSEGASLRQAEEQALALQNNTGTTKWVLTSSCLPIISILTQQPSLISSPQGAPKNAGRSIPSPISSRLLPRYRLSCPRVPTTILFRVQSVQRRGSGRVSPFGGSRL